MLGARQRRRARIALDGVEKTNNIRVGRIKLVPRTERLKSQEQEVPEKITYEKITYEKKMIL